MQKATKIRFGPFRFDVPRKLLLRAGHQVELSPNQMKALDFILQNRERLITYHDLIEAIWPNDSTGKSYHDVQKVVRPCCNLLVVGRHAFIQNAPRQGYRFMMPQSHSGAVVDGVDTPAEAISPASQVGPRTRTRDLNVTPIGQVDLEKTLVIQEETPVSRSPALSLPLRSDIQEFRNKYPYAITVIGEFIELHHSPFWRGWRSGEVGFEELGEYAPPPEFEPLLERYKPKFNKSYYSLRGFGPLPTEDDEQDLMVYVLGGSFHHVYALSMIYEEQQLHEDCRAFRRACEKSFLPIARSPLYHNVNCEVVVVTEDHKIVLGRRRTAAALVPGAWTASLEEQMLRYDPSPEATIKKDKGLFECAERGATGELGITVDRRKPTLLLSVGVEWRNFTAAFVFLVNANEEFVAIRDECWPGAPDRNEAIALDCISADPSAIRKALSTPQWLPTSSAKADPIIGQDAIRQDVWHHTALARLEAYLQHILLVNVTTSLH